MEWLAPFHHIANFLSEIQDYFKYIIEKYETLTHNPPVRKYVNQKENRITFRIKTGYYPEPLTTKETKLLGSTKVRQQSMKMEKMCLIYKLLN